MFDHQNAVLPGKPLSSKESAHGAGDAGAKGSVPALGRSPGGRSGDLRQYILAWRIPWTEEPGALQSVCP